MGISVTPGDKVEVFRLGDNVRKKNEGNFKSTYFQDLTFSLDFV